MALAQIFQIDELRAQQLRDQESTCYCDAARAARKHFSVQLRELSRMQPKPRILCLESLGEGIPAVPGGWDVIYSATLFQSLPASAARQVLKGAAALLAPGGQIWIANVCSAARLERCPRCLKSGSAQRDEIAMVDLTRELHPHSIAGQLVYRDRLKLNICMELHKDASFLSDAPRLSKIS